MPNLAPYGRCVDWNPQIIWTSAAADSISAFSMLAILGVLYYFLRRAPNFRSPATVILFPLFIVSSLAAYVMQIVTLWAPLFYPMVVMKGLSAVFGFSALVATTQLARRLGAPDNLPSLLVIKPFAGLKFGKSLLAVFTILFLLLAFFLYRLSLNYGLPSIQISKQNGYKLLLNGRPYLIKGVCYLPIPVGKDYEYNFWGDSNKPWLVDGKLMKEMGVNTVRIYRVGKNPAQVKQVLSDLHKKFGIRALLGTYLGLGSWPPPNYTNEEFKEKVRTEVIEMVRVYKDQPAVLMWVLGNENNYSFDRNVQPWTSDEIEALPTPEARRREKARIYYSFVNSLAKEIKKIDTRHPVVLGVGEVGSLEIAKEECPDIDMIGMISYRGPGFGNLFRQIKQKFDLPVVMIEWGADSYNAFRKEPDEENQAEFIRLQWRDIERNSDPKKGVGNCVGGTLFEWSDEWWKGNENLPYTWSVQDTAAHWYNNSYYYDAQAPERLNMNEEWWGAVGLDPKRTDSGNNHRLLRKSYTVLQSAWTRKGA